MRYKRFENKVFVRIDKDEEIVETLRQICKILEIKLGTITGIGATDNVKIGLFNPNSKEYHSTELFDDHEIAPLYGNITSMDDKPYLHLHVNLCNKEHNSFGGHLESAIVSATSEVTIDIIKGKINRINDKNIGLNLMDI
jgi:predicted DNA-binding protein with PD1-like motif